jgi:single-stranded-DNA-specific exonuclease
LQVFICFNEGVITIEYELINPINENYSALEQVLTNRGMAYEDIPHYLNVTNSDNLSPLKLKNIEKAAQIIIKHISNDDARIYVQVDSDCDGYTASAVLLNYLGRQFPSAIEKFSYDFHDGKVHGINTSLIPEGTTLVIAPDSSSNDYDIHQELKEKGIDVVVLDHHLAERESEYACVVNNQLCDYPTKSLSGVGIVYKFCQYLDSICGTAYADDYLDIVGCGIQGDMMNLQDFETHYLVQEGLRRAHLRNPFIKGMAQKNEYQLGTEDLTPMGVSFYIVPLVNAITRVGTQEEKRLVFESMLEWKADELIPSTKRGCKGQLETRVEQALRTCTNVKNRQTKVRDASAAQIESIIEQDNLLSHKLLLIRVRELAVDPGVRGLIANELMSKYKRPVAILSPVETEGELVWAGSARGYERSKLTDFRSFCESSGLVNYATGHNNAFGLAIPDRNFEEFVSWSEEQLKDIEFSPCYKVDFIYSGSTVKAESILEIGDAKALWGQGLEEPLIVIENLPVTRDMVTLMSRDRNPTLKILLPNGIACIKFRSSEEELESLTSNELGCVNMNIIGRAEVNKYFNRVTPQILVVDYEILGRQKYYF